MAASTFSHVGITCKDPIKVEKFYTEYFAFQRARVYNPGPEQVVMLKKGDIYLELFKTEENSPLDRPEKDGYPFPGLRHIAFIVDDLDEILEEFGDDAEITMGPLDMSEFIEGMRVCWVRDPEGNIVELNQGYVDEKNPPQLNV